MQNTQSNTTLKYLIIIVAVAVLLAVGLSFLSKGDTGSHQYDALASCLAERGAKFYGAFWCPHCQDQKKLFSASAKLLPYIECSTPDGAGQTEECKAADIQSYPTWEFADGSRLSKVMTPEELAEKTSCQSSLGLETSTTTSAE